MLRYSLIAASLLTLAACATGTTLIMPDEALRRAKADAAFRDRADDYASFAKARYASLTNDPTIAAGYYARIADEPDADAQLAERAVFSALLVGDVDTAIKLSKRLSAETLAATDLPRLTLAVDALRRNRPSKALSYFDSPWDGRFHAVIASSISAWTALEDDTAAAIKQQANAGDGDLVMSGVARNLAALMQLNQGNTAQAQADLALLWDDGARLAIGVETDARLLALEGKTDAALKRLKDFRETVGRNPALTDLARQIEAGAVTQPPTRNAKQGAALAIYAITAAVSPDYNSDLPSVYYALALHLDPDLDAARALWAETLDQADRRAEAITLLEQVREGSIYHTNAQGQLAWVLRREGRNDEALALAQDTLKRTKDRNIRIQLADLLQSLGKDGQAEAAFTQIIDSDAANGIHDWRIYFARGAARERLGQWPPAEVDLRAALGLKPDNPQIMNYLGYSWVSRGERLQDGLRLIENALRLDPYNGAITDSLGWAHYKMQNYDRAITYLERATELSPQSAEILDHLGDTYWQTGRYTEAGYQWQRALEYETDDEKRSLIERKLDGGFALLKAAGAPQTP